MLVAVMSDAHDEEENLRRATQLAKQAGCARLLYLGDLVSPGTLRALYAAWGGPMDLVAGNNDYPRSTYHEAVREMTDTRFYDEATELEINGRRIYIMHVPGYALRTAAMNGYDAIFYGHTHRPDLQRIERTLIANPGDLQGRFGHPSFAIYDSEENTLRFVPLQD